MNTAYFSLLRGSLIELVKRSTDTTDSKDVANEEKLNFYRQFINKKSMISCKIIGTETVSKANLQRNYAVYCIQIMTADLQFVVKKRYSQFQQLYNCCNRKQQFSNQFPKKTIFQAGWSDEITRTRIIQLNKILIELTQEGMSQTIKCIFYDFIQLEDHYRQEGLLFLKNEIPSTDDYLLLSISKLNEKTNHCLQVFEQIKLSISDRKRKICYDLAKSILIGYGNYSGLISFVMNSDNQLILIEGFQLMNWLLSPQMNRDYEIFARILQKCTPNLLILEYFQKYQYNCEVQIGYFKLLRQYLELKQNITIKDLDTYFQKENMLESQFNQWLKYYNFSHI